MCVVARCALDAPLSIASPRTRASALGFAWGAYVQLGVRSDHDFPRSALQSAIRTPFSIPEFSPVLAAPVQIDCLPVTANAAPSRSALRGTWCCGGTEYWRSFCAGAPQAASNAPVFFAAFFFHVFSSFSFCI
jgi:hypothetical protein